MRSIFLLVNFKQTPAWLGEPDGTKVKNISNGCELGASNGVCAGNFQSDPDSLMWKDALLVNPDEP